MSLKSLTPAPLPDAKPLPKGVASPKNPCSACAVRVLSVCDAIDEMHLHRLSAIVTTHDVEPRRTFVSEGDPADHLFNVTSGTVKVYKLLADGRQQITGFLFAGDFLGLSSNLRYAYSAEAITRVTYCRFGRKQLEQLLADFPQMEHRLLGIASNELAAAQDQMLLLGRKTAREKVASFILFLSRRAAKAGRKDNAVNVPMTRADIADYLGLTVETVSRVFTQLRKDRVIELPSPDHIRILDQHGLMGAAESS